MSFFIFFSVVLGLLGLFFFFWWQRNTDPGHVLKNGPFKGRKTPSGGYDVVIVGAGPGGSTTAYFLAKQGLKVALLERKTFPREKYCGDAWCSPALDILEEMGVLQEIEAKNLCHPVKRGGFYSPFGYSCVGGPYGSVSKIRTYAIKRYIVDEFIARKAAAVGAELFEETTIEQCQFEEADDDGMWHVSTPSGEKTFRGRILIIADGSNSYLAKKLGLVQNQPEAVCSHQYVEGGSHHFEADGVMFFNKSVLPGYSALFKHYNGDMYLGTYILPGGDATSRVIPSFEKNLVAQHPYVKQSFGDDYKWRVRLKTAPIRIGGIKKSYAKQLLIVGDAAGQVDPMTGEGIHTAMIAAKIAAQTILEMFEEGDFSEKSCKVYHDRWMKEFGNEFFWSALGARFIYRFPIVLDAVCVVGARRGQQFLDDFGEIMTGVKSKAEFLKPKHSIPILLELIRQIILQKVLGKKPLAPGIETQSKKQ